VSAPFIKLTLSLPLFASAASLLFHAVNNPVPLIIPVVFHCGLTLFCVVFAGVFAFAVFTPIAQSILVTSLFAELAFIFPIFASAALFHFCITPIMYHTSIADTLILDFSSVIDISVSYSRVINNILR
jgi:hypothetical protein